LEDSLPPADLFVCFKESKQCRKNMPNLSDTARKRPANVERRLRPSGTLYPQPKVMEEKTFRRGPRPDRSAHRYQIQEDERGGNHADARTGSCEENAACEEMGMEFEQSQEILQATRPRERRSVGHHGGSRQRELVKSPRETEGDRDQDNLHLLGQIREGIMKKRRTPYFPLLGGKKRTPCGPPTRNQNGPPLFPRCRNQNGPPTKNRNGSVIYNDKQFSERSKVLATKLDLWTNIERGGRRVIERDNICRSHHRAKETEQ